jgi:hypothetical protein
MTLKQTGKILTCLMCKQTTLIEVSEEPPQTCPNPKCGYHAVEGLPRPDYAWWVERNKWEHQQRG